MFFDKIPTKLYTVFVHKESVSRNWWFICGRYL